MKFNIFDYKDKKNLGCGVEPVMSSREDVHDPACVTHDYRYVEHDKSRKESDNEFLDNMLKINNRFKSGSMRAFLNARSYLWYGIVRLFGGKAYGGELVIMNFGIDCLALAKYKNETIAYLPKNWGIGAFTKVDGFGDGLRALVEVLRKRRDIPFVRLHLMWRHDHNFTSRDYEFVRREAKRVLPIIQRYSNIKFYISPVCEHRLDETKWNVFASIVAKELASVAFTLVNSPKKTGRFKNVINEYHHGKGGDAFSYDGANCFDSDVETDKENYINAPYFFFWNCQFNGRMKLEDETARPERRAYPVKEHFESIKAISGKRGNIKTNIKGLIGKSHSDQHDNKPAGKDCKPVYITPLNVSPRVLTARVRGRIIATSSIKQPYNEKKNGKVGRQIGWRYYFPKWGYQISSEVVELWGDNRKLADTNLAFRCFNYR